MKNQSWAAYSKIHLIFSHITTFAFTFTYSWSLMTWINAAFTLIQACVSFPGRPLLQGVNSVWSLSYFNFHNNLAPRYIKANFSFCGTYLNWHVNWAHLNFTGFKGLISEPMHFWFIGLGWLLFLHVITFKARPFSTPPSSAVSSFRPRCLLRWS